MAEEKKEEVKEEEAKKKKKKGMKKFFSEFKEFIMRGNILDMAIGIIIGGAFQKVVSSLVNDIIMPLISILVKVDIKTASIILQEAVMDKDQIIQAAIEWRYGNFIQTVIDFLIIGLSIFVMLKTMLAVNKKLVAQKQKALAKLKKKETEALKSTDAEKKEESTEEKAESDSKEKVDQDKTSE